MRSDRCKYNMKKRMRKRVFSVLTLLFLLVQTVLSPVAQYANAEGIEIDSTTINATALEGETTELPDNENQVTETTVAEEVEEESVDSSSVEEENTDTCLLYTSPSPRD